MVTIIIFRSLGVTLKCMDKLKQRSFPWKGDDIFLWDFLWGIGSGEVSHCEMSQLVANQQDTNQHLTPNGVFARLCSFAFGIYPGLSIRNCAVSTLQHFLHEKHAQHNSSLHAPWKNMLLPCSILYDCVEMGPSFEVLRRWLGAEAFFLASVELPDLGVWCSCRMLSIFYTGDIMNHHDHSCKILM